MKPRIDITITDTNGAYSSLADGIEPYEVYVNNEPVCTPMQMDEVIAENEKLEERVEWLDGECRNHMSASVKFFEMVGEYQRENNRMHKLLKSVLVLKHDPAYKWLDARFYEIHGSSFTEQARELGIEMD